MGFRFLFSRSPPKSPSPSPLLAWLQTADQSNHLGSAYSGKTVETPPSARQNRLLWPRNHRHPRPRPFFSGPSPPVLPSETLSPRISRAIENGQTGETNPNKLRPSYRLFKVSVNPPQKLLAPRAWPIYSILSPSTPSCLCSGLKISRARLTSNYSSTSSLTPACRPTHPFSSPKERKKK